MENNQSLLSSCDMKFQSKKKKKKDFGIKRLY